MFHHSLLHHTHLKEVRYGPVWCLINYCLFYLLGILISDTVITISPTLSCPGGIYVDEYNLY